MKTSEIKYNFNSKPWKYNGPNGWIFVSLPNEISMEIRQNFKGDEEGWGRLKATAKIGNTTWETAIWFESKSQTYLLPLKAEVRKKESIEIDKAIEITIYL